jgi:hypothetical protein
MNDTPTLDNIEQQVIRTLSAKADQIAVEDTPFRPRELAPGEIVWLAPAPRQHRRVLAVAAAAAVLVGALGIVHRLSSADDADMTLSTTLTGQRYSMRAAGPAAFVPARLPEGWTLQQWSPGSTMFGGSEVRWQLFGGREAAPVGRGVLVGSATNDEARVIPNPTHTVHGQPATVGPSPDPRAPAGTLQASWIDGDVVHDALAVGTTEAELVAFLGSLVALEDPATGFEGPADGGLSEIDAAAVDDQYTSSLTYAGPAGENDTITVTAESSDHYGGLLHRLVGEPGSDGVVIHGQLDGDPDLPFVSLARHDGWTIEVQSQGSPSVAQDPALLDTIVASLEPVTGQQLIDSGLAAPVTATEAVGEWTIEVHGTGVDNLAMCLTPGSGETACTTAESSAGAPGLTTGSAIVGGEWIVAALTDGPDPAVVQTAPSLDHGWPEDFSPEELGGERQRSGDRLVQVFAIPPDVEAVDVMIPTGEEAAGFAYDRPAG